MAAEKYPYENLKIVDISHDKGGRYKPDRGFPSVNVKNKKKHADKIKKDLGSLTDEINQKASEQGIDPKLIFKIKFKQNVSEKDLARYGCDFLGDLASENNAQVVFSNQEQLKDFYRKWEKFRSDDLTLEGNAQHKNFFANIVSLSRLSAEDRKGFKLRDMDIEKNKIYFLDVDLWFSDTRAECLKDQENIKKILGDEGKITDFYIGDSIHLLRVKATGARLKELLEEERVCQIDIPPKLMSEFHQKLDLDLDKLNPVEVEADSPAVCVIDSGIVPEHPLIRNALADSKVFREDLDDDIDEHGHGTMVAGIAVYGDLEESIENGLFKPSVRLLSARVTDSNSNLGPDDKLYIKQIEEAIKYYHENFNCRIFNLSLGDPNHYFSGQQYQSRWAHILDNLARKRNLIIVISTGNINEKHFNEDFGLEGEEIKKNFPFYLYTEEAGLLNPATAVNCISVGSINTELRTSRGFMDHSQKEKGIDRLRISKENEPSAFTRTGPGFNDTVKPDLVAYGGNMYYHARTNKLISNDYQSGIPSLNNNFFDDGKLFSCASGTSFSTPYISNLAAKILNYNKDFKNNTVRALLANSADYPLEVTEGIENYMQEMQSVILARLSQLKENTDDEELIELITSILDKRFLNTQNKNKLLKSGKLDEETKRLITAVPGVKAEYDDFLLRTSGYGFPDIDRALKSSETKVTLWAENSIKMDRFDVYKIPIPEDFISKTGLRKITVSLAFSPPVRHTRKDYAGYIMDFELVRGIDLEETLERAANDDKSENITDLGGERCSFCPKTGVIKNSTLQKATFEIKRTPKEYGNCYYLIVVSQDKWITNSAEFIETTDEENYSVVITLEHKKEEVKMYNEIKERIDQEVEVKPELEANV